LVRITVGVATFFGRQRPLTSGKRSLRASFRRIDCPLASEDNR
jgi:hypothetical protein